ncbi:hypothetical protein [Phyllobacterium brassicacearum]|uniref:hypothetical protein n=1 Tax=Phyllobacterium brassicacearum TaxID=314235 RepID=UPI00141525C7|nr:hypothetical protein [Phyllobacterium brassicacearum]
MMEGSRSLFAIVPKANASPKAATKVAMSGVWLIILTLCAPLTIDASTNAMKKQRTATSHHADQMHDNGATQD